MLKIGLSTKQKPVEEALFKTYRDGKIDMMELAMSREDFDQIDFTKIGEWSKTYGVEVWSVHLPFSAPFDISNPEVSEETVAYHKELMKKAADVGIRTFVVHPSGEPIEDRERRLRLETAKASLHELTEEAVSLGVTLCVEDLPRTCLGHSIDEMCDLASAHPNLRICFDTNHLTLSPMGEFIRTFGKRIGTIHVSDFDFVDEQHWVPGEGKIDWQNIYQTLLEEGYHGPWMYEVSFLCPKSIKRRTLRAEDFYKNAKEIFEGRPLTVIGVPKK